MPLQRNQRARQKKKKKERLLYDIGFDKFEQRETWLVYFHSTQITQIVNRFSKFIDA
jgi:hypothetical protein